VADEDVDPRCGLASQPDSNTSWPTLISWGGRSPVVLGLDPFSIVIATGRGVRGVAVGGAVGKDFLPGGRLVRRGTQRPASRCHFMGSAASCSPLARVLR
jgi:hypothetical protein